MTNKRLQRYNDRVKYSKKEVENVKRKFLALGLTIIIILSTTACSKIPALDKFFSKFNKDTKEEEVINIEDGNFPVSVLDVEIATQPNRVVFLSPALLEKALDLGLTDHIIGGPDFSGIESSSGLTPCGTSVIPNIAEIEGLKTDLLITSAPLSAADLQRLEDNGIDVLVIPTPNDLPQLLEVYQNLAIALEGETDGGKIGDEFTQKLEGWFNNLENSLIGEEPLSFLYIRRLDGTVATGDTLESHLLSRLNLTNIAEEYTGWLIPKEDLQSQEGKALLSETDYYLFDGEEVDIKMLEQSEIYKGLDATLKDRFIIIDYQLFERQSLSMFNQLLEIVSQVFPETDLPSWNWQDSTVDFPDENDENSETDDMINQDIEIDEDATLSGEEAPVESN